jgi:hypothetical protein
LTLHLIDCCVETMDMAGGNYHANFSGVVEEFGTYMLVGTPEPSALLLLATAALGLGWRRAVWQRVNVTSTQRY